MSPATALQEAVTATWAEVKAAEAEIAALEVVRYAPHKTKKSLAAAKAAWVAAYDAGRAPWDAYYRAKTALAEADAIAAGVS